MENLILLPSAEVALRIGRLRDAARAAGRGGALLIADNAMLYYLTGRVYSGWAYIPVDAALKPVWFVRRPVELAGEDVVEVRKPEEIPSRLEAMGQPLPEAIGLEADTLPYSTVTRLQAVFPDAAMRNCPRHPSRRDTCSIATSSSKSVIPGEKSEGIRR